MADFEENVEEIVGRLEKRRVATESGGDETGDETGGPGDKTAATAGDERNGGDRWGNVYGRRELEFDENEMAALEGRVWCRYAVIPLAELSRCFAGR